MPKTVTLKTGKEVYRGQEIDVTTKDLILLALDSPPPQQGFKFSDLQKRARVQSAVDSSDGLHVDLEDADWQTLKDCANAAGWMQRTKFLLDFLEQFNK